MNQQPDKLFRKKLEGYQRPAPASAWDKIESGLDKKSNKGLWLKIAASLLLLSIATYLLWPATQDTDTMPPSISKVSPDKKEDLIKEDPKTTTAHVAPDEPLTIPEARQEKQPVAVAKKKKETNPIKKEITTPAPKTVAKEESPVMEEILQAETTVATNTHQTETPETIPTTNTLPVAAEQNITLVFTADEADGYLDKKALAEATSDDKKPSTLKKLLKKAQDLKNNQDPFGELRQKKNEILALNFKSEKQRGQNK